MKKADNISRLIKGALKTRGMTQSQMAAELGISHQTFKNRLSRNSISVTAAVDMLDMLGFDLCAIDRESGKVLKIEEKSDT